MEREMIVVTDCSVIKTEIMMVMAVVVTGVDIKIKGKKEKRKIGKKENRKKGKKKRRKDRIC
jgi:hypothetical protein